MVSGRTCSITSNLQDEIDAEHILKGGDHYHQPGQQEDQTERGIVNDRVEEEPQESTGRILMQSVSDILVQSAQSVKDLVSCNGYPTTVSEDMEEKTLLQSVGEKIVQSAQSVKDVVNGSAENENGEERTLLQSVSERIVQSARNVKDAVNGNGESLETDADDTGEASILVHSVLD